MPQIKIINQIKKISPKTVLVAFKAEYGSGEKLLVREGIKKLKESGRLKRVGPDKGGHWEAK